MMADDGFFELQENHVESTSFSLFAKMKERGKLCNVTIGIGNESTRAHPLVLESAVGLHFDFLMNKEAKIDVRVKAMYMEGIDLQALKCLIDFPHMSMVKISNEGGRFYLETSISLQTDEVTDACFEFMSDGLNPSNVLMIRFFAIFCGSKEAMKNADLYIRENFEAVSRSEEFLNLSFTTLQEFIRADDLHVLREEIVFEAVMNWIKAAKQERRDFLQELLLDVRMQLLSPEYLASRASTDELIQASLACMQLVEKAKMYHAPVKKGMEYSGFTKGERRCKSKHHLKCAMLKGGMYFIYSTTTGTISIHYYDPTGETWVSWGETNQLGDPDYVVCTEDNIYFIGRESVHKLNLSTLESHHLTRIVDIPSWAGICLHNNRIYFFGGTSRVANMVLSLDPNNSKWEWGYKMLNNRTDPRAVSLGEYIYITGGYKGKKVHKSVERYNPSTGEIVEISPMNDKRWGHSCTVLNGRIYVAGGYSNLKNLFSNTAEVYDPMTDKWGILCNTVKIAEVPVSLFSYDDQLYMSYADRKDTNNFCIDVYDHIEYNWKYVETVNASCNFRALIVVSTNSASSF